MESVSAQLTEGALLDVVVLSVVSVESGASSSYVERIDRKEPKTDEFGRFAVLRGTSDGRERAGEGWVLLMGLSSSWSWTTSTSTSGVSKLVSREGGFRCFLVSLLSLTCCFTPSSLWLVLVGWIWVKEGMPNRLLRLSRLPVLDMTGRR